MLTLEMAISLTALLRYAKLRQLSLEKQKLVVLLVEYLDKETESDRRKLLKEKLETAINNTENISLVDKEKLVTSIFQR